MALSSSDGCSCASYWVMSAAIARSCCGTMNIRSNRLIGVWRLDSRRRSNSRTFEEISVNEGMVTGSFKMMVSGFGPAHNEIRIVGEKTDPSLWLKTATVGSCFHKSIFFSATRISRANATQTNRNSRKYLLHTLMGAQSRQVQYVWCIFVFVW